MTAALTITKSIRLNIKNIRQIQKTELNKRHNIHVHVIKLP